MCNRILNLDPSDGLAFHCKMVAMLQTGKFDEALKQMEANKLELELSFEQAYAHYRLNNLDRSLAILDSLKVPQVAGQYNNNNYYYHNNNYNNYWHHNNNNRHHNNNNNYWYHNNNYY